MRSRTLLLSRTFRFYAARRQIPTQHAVPSGSMAGSGTEEGLIVDSQLRLFNEKSTETCHPFGILPYDPLPRTLALIMLTRLETLLCNWSLLMRLGYLLVSKTSHKHPRVLLGSRLDTYPPFPGRRSGASYPSALRRKTIQLSKDVLDSSDRLPRVLSARRFPCDF